MSVVFVGKHFLNGNDRGVRTIEEGKRRITEHVFETIGPVVAEYFLEDIKKASCYLHFVGIVYTFHWIEGDRKFSISRIKKNYVINTFFRNIPHNIVDEIAVWIQNSEALSIFNIINNEQLEKFRFTRTRLTDGIEMTTSIVTLYPKRNEIIMIVRNAKPGNVRISKPRKVLRWIGLASLNVNNVRDEIGVWEVVKRCNFFRTCDERRAVKSQLIIA